MQPVDALTIRAVLQEAKPLLINRKVERVHQLARDEIIIALRSRAGSSHLLLSAHPSSGRLCLVNLANLPRPANLPAFALILRKHLTGATVVGVEQLLGERVVDIIFSCVDEVGGVSLKVLSAEIMGRHSNLIFWSKENNQIIGASHIVTKEMSRQREVLPGLTYVRPPSQEKPNIVKLTEEEFSCQLSRLLENPLREETVADWLLSSFAGLGRHLAEEVAASVAREQAIGAADGLRAVLWQKLGTLKTLSEYRPAMRLDLSRFSVLSWLAEAGDAQLWRAFPSVNDMLDEYFRALAKKERFQQLRDRLNSELRSQGERLESRRAAALEQLEAVGKLSQYKNFGDFILSHLSEIASGQKELICQDFYASDGGEVTIPLNPNLSASQNAQQYYRQFSKLRARAGAATAAEREASEKLGIIQLKLERLAASRSIEQLEELKDGVLKRRLPEPSRLPAAPKRKLHSRLLSLVSSDGWTIYLGRNRQENEELITRLARPQDIWLHVQGHGGAHVLIKVPSGKTEPPATTLAEAAQAAARLSKTLIGGKVRVMYTQCRYLRKVQGSKPGLVTYENERTIEVDTSVPMPAPLKQLFAQRHGRPGPHA